MCCVDTELTRREKARLAVHGFVKVTRVLGMKRPASNFKIRLPSINACKLWGSYSHHKDYRIMTDVQDI